MLCEIGTYRFFTSFRMTRLRFVVILSEAKDLCDLIILADAWISTGPSALNSSLSTLNAPLYPTSMFVSITLRTSSAACMNAPATLGSKWLPEPSSMMAMAFSKGKPSL